MGCSRTVTLFDLPSVSSKPGFFYRWFPRPSRVKSFHAPLVYKRYLTSGSLMSGGQVTNRHRLSLLMSTRC